MPLELKIELMFQKRHVEELAKSATGKEKEICEKWLQSVNKLISICTERNRF